MRRMIGALLCVCMLFTAIPMDGFAAVDANGKGLNSTVAVQEATPSETKEKDAKKANGFIDLGMEATSSDAKLNLQKAGTNYLTFKSTKAFSISCAAKVWEGTLYYSVNAASWTVWNGENVTAEKSGTEYYLYFRGTCNKTMTNYGWYPLILDSNGAVSCSGNIETLLDYQEVAAGRHPEMGISCFMYMFKDWEDLVSAPSLPAMTLVSSCYSGLFFGCSGLKKAPSLPATTLAETCYDYMFAGCTSLITAPVLPATQLTSSCYLGMFKDCTSLKKTPMLPATQLVDSCYCGMFAGCTGLTEAPVLASMQLANGCYESMFDGCSGLKKAPVLPAMRLEIGCYNGMFAGCTGLTAGPKLPATVLSESAYGSMFAGCTGLTSAPELPATQLDVNCYAQMFAGCTGLTAAPALPATQLAGACYFMMFRDCTGLEYLPVLPAKKLAEGCYYNMFYGCSKLKIYSKKQSGYSQVWSIPSSATAADSFNYQMFAGTGGSFTGDPVIGTVYYVKNTAKSYNLVYKLNGGELPSGVVNIKSFRSDQTSFSLTAPVRTGYSFTGWNTKADGSGTGFTTKVTVSKLKPSSKGTVTLYAQWKANTYTVKFGANGGTGTMQSLTGRKYGSSYTLPANGFKKTGVVFLAWNTKADGSGTAYKDKTAIKNLTPKAGGTVTLYAQWGYQITYVLNGGKNSEKNPSGYKKTETVKLSNPTRTGYTFAGWYSDKKLTGSKVTKIVKGSTGSKTFYAKWTVNKYTIKFNANGGTGTMKSLTGITYGKSKTLTSNTFKRTGYTFAGWSTTKTGKVKYKNKASVKNLSSTNGATVTLYAVWTKTKYTVTYKLNGGKNSSKNPSGYYVTTSIITLKNPTRSGYTFVGWYSDSKCTKKVTSIQKGSTGNKTLYAKWKK